MLRKTYISIAYALCVSLVLFLSSCSSAQIEGSGILNLRSSIIKLRDNILGVSKFQEYMNTGENIKYMKLDGDTIVEEVSSAMSLKFKERMDAVEHLHKAAKETYTEPNKWGKWRKCCDIRPESVKYNLKYGSKVNETLLCVLEAPTATEKKKMPSRDFLDVARANLRAHPGIKWQYFGSDKGILTQFPAAASCPPNYDNRFRPWYVQASTPKPKDLILVIDRSESMIKNGRKEAAIESAITVLNTLTPDDRVGVVTFSTEAHALGTHQSEEYTSVPVYEGKPVLEPTDTACYNNTMAAASPENIKHLSRIVRLIEPSGMTYYGKALTIAFNFLQDAYNRDMQSRKSNDTDDVTGSRERAILFLSDGKPSDRPYDIFKLIQRRNKMLRNSVVLLCFALGQGPFGRALQIMAKQEFNFHDDSQEEMVQCQIDVDCGVPLPTPGLFHHVNETTKLRSAMGLYYSFFSSRARSQPGSSAVAVQWSVPYFDAWSLGMVFTAAAPVVVNGDLLGVVGVDLTVHELMADVTYFREAGHLAYAFLVDYTGRVLIHPFLPDPLAVNDSFVTTNIDVFERSPDVKRFLSDSLHYISTRKAASGQPLREGHVFAKVFKTTRVFPTVHESVVTHDTTSRYSCSAIKWTEFMLCVVIEADADSASLLEATINPPEFKFLYHRFDLYPPRGQLICSNQGQILTPNASSVMFSPSAFEDPGEYSENLELPNVVGKYIRYMTTGSYARNSTQLFKKRVRSAVLASWKLEEIWSESGTSSLSDRRMLEHVVWRYFGSEEGVFRIFPGVIMPKLYDPVDRPWYEMAHALMLEYFTHHIPEETRIPLSRREVAAVSPPYIDANGAGLVITLSAAVTEPMGESDGERPPHVLGVMGADIHLKYLEELLWEQVRECKNATYFKCIIIDTSGYVIYDDYLITGDKRAVYLASLSNYHIIHSHPSVSTTLINNRILVREKCIDVGSTSFKTNYHVDLMELNKGKPVDFAISYVPGTNIILMSIPIAFRSTDVCTTHTLDVDPCKPEPAGLQDDRPSGGGFKSRCESPCIDNHGAMRRYSRCTTRYNYTWGADPPPCLPVKYQAWGGKAKLNGSSAVQESYLTKLPECFGMPAISDTYRLLPTQRDKARVAFLVYVILCACLIVSIWLGLNKTRLRSYVRASCTRVM